MIWVAVSYYKDGSYAFSPPYYTRDAALEHALDDVDYRAASYSLMLSVAPEDIIGQRARAEGE